MSNQQVNTHLRQLQLLYGDMSEEVVCGRDYEEMLSNGHLLDVQDIVNTTTTTTTTNTGAACGRKGQGVLAWCWHQCCRFLLVRMRACWHPDYSVCGV